MIKNSWDKKLPA